MGLRKSHNMVDIFARVSVVEDNLKEEPNTRASSGGLRVERREQLVRVRYWSRALMTRCCGADVGFRFLGHRWRKESVTVAPL